MAYVYRDIVRPDIIRMVPADGKVIGSIGCGYGALEALLVGQGRQVYGVDTSAEAVARAKGRLTDARCVRPDETDLFPGVTLDGLILADVIEHIPDPHALTHFASFVRPGGWVLISVPNMRQLDVAMQFLRKGDWPEQPEGGIYDITHVHVMTKVRLERWCAAANLQIEKWFDCELGTHPRGIHLIRLFDRLTLKRFNSWFQYELQCICRKMETPNGGGKS